LAVFLLIYNASQEEVVIPVYFTFEDTAASIEFFVVTPKQARFRDFEFTEQTNNAYITAKETSDGTWISVISDSNSFSGINNIIGSLIFQGKIDASDIELSHISAYCLIKDEAGENEIVSIPVSATIG
jgi:hypothetical protein